MSPHHPFSRAQETPDGAARTDRSVGQDLDNIFRLTAPQLGAAAPPKLPERLRGATGAEPRRLAPPDFDAALDMLNRASKAMDLMQTRYKQVEDYAKGVAERAEKDIAVAYAQAHDWEVRAASFESKLEEMRERAEAAEHRAEAAEQNARDADTSAKDAHEWLECFYDKIVSSFDTRNFLKGQAA